MGVKIVWQNNHKQLKFNFFVSKLNIVTGSRDAIACQRNPWVGDWLRRVARVGLRAALLPLLSFFTSFADINAMSSVLNWADFDFRTWARPWVAKTGALEVCEGKGHPEECGPKWLQAQENQKVFVNAQTFYKFVRSMSQNSNILI